MIVGFLLIGALLVDRFVLLPEFDGGRGSDGVAVGAWLGVNLLPAIVWLLLNAREGERSRGQLLAGTLALATTTAVLIVPVLIWWTATGSTAGDVAQLNPSLSPTPEAEQLVERCGDSGGGEAAVREHFVDAAPSDPASLLMEGTRFQPGEKFSVAVRNDSATEVMHGAGTTIEDVDTGETVKLDVAIATPLIGIVVPGGQTGPCVSVLIPTGAEPGAYRAVLESSSGRQTGDRLEGEFAIIGEPVAHGWEEEREQALEEAREKLGR